MVVHSCSWRSLVHTTKMTTTTMRAVVYREFGGPIRVETDVPVPRCCNDGEEDDDSDSIVVRVAATGVCRSDWHGWKGHDFDLRRFLLGNENGRNDDKSPSFVMVPGHEASGVVAEVGGRSAATNFRVGDRVAVPFILSCGQCSYCRHGHSTVCADQRQPGFTQRGTFAEYVKVPRASRNVRLLPPNVTFEQAAAVGCRFGTAYRAVVQQGGLLAEDDDDDVDGSASANKEKTLVVVGCGGLGLGCVMIAAAVRAGRIVAVDVNADALRKAVALGATHAVRIRPKTQQQREQQQLVLRHTPDGEGADLSVDAAGFASTCELAVLCTRRRGRMIQVGLPIGGGTTSGGGNSNNNTIRAPQVPMGLVAGRELELVGSHGFDGDALERLLQLIERGKLDPSLLIERRVSLEEGARALADMDRGSPVGITMITKFRDDDDEGGDNDLARLISRL